MLKSKKMFALCATTLAGFSTLATLPITAMADVAKTGDTTISYEGSGSKPAEWGLSVPATVSLDKDGTQASATKYGSAAVSIVKTDGTAFEDSSKDREFNVSLSSAVTATVAGEEQAAMQSADGTKTLLAYYLPLGGQGAVAPQPVTGQGVMSVSDWKAGFDITSNKAGNADKPTTMNVTFGMEKQGVDFKMIDLTKDYSTTVSWTAKEK